MHKTVWLQNVGEARQLVTLYQYLRVKGYPANKISILTTYNGQKALLREEIDNRCFTNPAVREVFGRPHKVRTPASAVERCSCARSTCAFPCRSTPSIAWLHDGRGIVNNTTGSDEQHMSTPPVSFCPPLLLLCTRTPHAPVPTGR